MKYLLFLSLVFLGACSHGPKINRSITEANWDALKEESLMRWDAHRLATAPNGQSACYQGEVKEGLGALKDSFYKRAKDSHYWIEIGNCFFLDKKFSQAEFYYQMVINETKENRFKAIAYNNLGIIALEQENWSIAQDLFTKSMRLESRFKVPRYNLALLYLDFNLIDQARELVEKEQHLSDVDFMSINARIYLLKNDVASAGKIFNRLPQFSLKRADISVLYAWYLTMVKDYSKAESVLTTREPSSIKELESFKNKISEDVSSKLTGK